MIKYKNLTVLGTSHIAKQSIHQVKQAITTIKPEIIALELDRGRFFALMSNNKRTSLKAYKKLGFKALLLNLIGAYLERKLSKSTGILPGTEMKTAIEIAKKNNIKIELIDQPIEITLKKLTTQLTRKEKFNLLKEFILSMFSKNNIEFDLNTVPSEKIIEKLISQTKKKYPTVHKILIKERNQYMAKALYKIININQDKNILAIVGAGHQKEITGELKSIKS